VAQVDRIRHFTTANNVLPHIVDVQFMLEEVILGQCFILYFVLFLVSVIRSMLRNHVYSTDGNNLKLNNTLK